MEKESQRVREEGKEIKCFIAAVDDNGHPDYDKMQV